MNLKTQQKIVLKSEIAFEFVFKLRSVLKNKNAILLFISIDKETQK